MKEAPKEKSTRVEATILADRAKVGKEEKNKEEYQEKGKSPKAKGGYMLFMVNIMTLVIEFKVLRLTYSLCQ